MDVDGNWMWGKLRVMLKRICYGKKIKVQVFTTKFKLIL